MKICEYATCQNKHDSHGYCANHARQLKKYGHPLSREEVLQKKAYSRSFRKTDNTGKHWNISEEKRLSMKGIRKNTGRTHFKEGYIPFNKGKASPFKDEASPVWKGDEVGIVALHAWVKRRLGFPDTCVNCRRVSANHQIIQWANKSHEYKRDLNDWLRLCAKCHKAYDTNRLTLQQIGVQ